MDYSSAQLLNRAFVEHELNAFADYRKLSVA